MFKFKMDIIELLRENGYPPARIRKEKLIGEKTMQDMKAGIVPGIKTLETLCKILEMQPGNLIKYEND
ncbi:helix-turn-helix transcriptional regulator [Enterocloster clostridioformis]|uniref:helix-turn-helix domain-containing protein n=1 Tax=Enterocloster clostridioformis TaxID=1531 RepID=UPI0026754B7C|nr:helix-turn-helix transcriptional regulator [Enterocloster clostridioformis]